MTRFMDFVHALIEGMDLNTARSILSRHGVNPDADDLKKMRQKLGLKHHPDRGGSLETMVQINAAIDALLNPSARQSAPSWAGQRKGPAYEPCPHCGAVFVKGRRTHAKDCPTVPPRRKAKSSGGSDTLTLLVDKVKAALQSGFSPRMAAIAGFFMDQEWVTTPIRSMSITSDGFVMINGNGMLGSAEDMDRNLESLLDAADVTDAERRLFHTLYLNKLHGSDWRPGHGRM